MSVAPGKHVVTATVANETRTVEIVVPPGEVVVVQVAFVAPDSMVEGGLVARAANVALGLGGTAFVVGAVLLVGSGVYYAATASAALYLLITTTSIPPQYDAAPAANEAYFALQRWYVAGIAALVTGLFVGGVGLGGIAAGICMHWLAPENVDEKGE
jgi:hypothetical protein